VSAHDPARENPVSPRPPRLVADDSSYWDEISELWLRERPQRLWRRHSDAVNEALVRRWLPGSYDGILKTDLFDEAVGTGLVPGLLVRSSRVVGIDVARPIVDAAAAQHPRLEAHCADVRSLPFGPADFDAVVSNSTLDHLASVEEIAGALRELRRVLRPGGRLVVSLDNPWNPAIAIRRALPRRLLDRTWRQHEDVAVRLLPAPVGATCGIRQLREVVRAAGFSVDDATAVLHVPRAPAILMCDRLDRRGDGRHEGVLRWLMAFEKLGGLPTRYVTGHFVAVLARRKE
jgi:SAM-dependent methyltransferase